MRSAAVALVMMAGLVLPVGADEATEAVRPDHPVSLFNGKDLSGWKPYLSDAKADPAKVWTVQDGVLHCSGVPAGYIRTEKTYRDYRLVVEYRWPGKGGNSGVLLHMVGNDLVWPKSIESQLMAGNAGDFYVIEGSDFAEHTDPSDRRVPNKTDDSEKELGQWNTMEILCDGDTITVFVNGEEVNKATKANITGGHICLQSEGTPIEFRRVELLPLKQEDASEKKTP